jgi:opacity protein-like surface antigen
MIDDSYIDKAMDNHWLLKNDSVTTPASISTSRDVQIRAVVEPIRDLKIDLNAAHTDNHARTIQYMFAGRPTTHSGSFNMTTISLKGALAGMGNANNGYRSSTFEHFCSLLSEFRDRVQAQGTSVNGAVAPVDPYAAEVMVPAFLSAYTSGAGNSLDIFPSLLRMLPNWTIRYGGLSNLPWVRDHLKSLNLNHGYKSVYSVGSYTLPSIPAVSINEAFSPLLGVDATFENNLTAKMEYRTTRVINLSMTSVQINEALSRDWVVGLAYKLQDFRLFNASSSRKIKAAQSRSKTGKANNSKNADNTRTASRSSGVNHDLNLRLDISFRKQAAITRDIATGASSASSGNSAFKLSFMADYTLSRLLTLTAYYDTQTNTPLLASSSYPTTTHDFGLSLKFSLTR